MVGRKNKREADKKFEKNENVGKINKKNERIDEEFRKKIREKLMRKVKKKINKQETDE